MTFAIACSQSTKACWKWALGKEQWLPMAPMLYDHELATTCHVALEGAILLPGGHDLASENTLSCPYTYFTIPLLSGGKWQVVNVVKLPLFTMSYRLVWQGK